MQRFTLNVAKPLITFEVETLELVLQLLDIKYFRLAMPSGRRVVFGSGFLIVIHDQKLPTNRDQCVYMYTTILTIGALTEYVCIFGVEFAHASAPVSPEPPARWHGPRNGNTLELLVSNSDRAMRCFAVHARRVHSPIPFCLC
jgi:hypothetical protein